MLGEALDLLGLASEADVILAEATPHATTDQERTSIAVRHASLLFRSLDRAVDAQRVIEDATAVVRDPACLRELHALEGDHLLLAGDVARAIEVDQPLLSGPADAAFAQASLDVGTALVLAGRTAEALDHTSAALAVRLDLDDELQLSRTGVYVVAHSLALAYAGRLEEAAAMAEVGYEVAVERGIVDGQAWLGSVLGIIRLMQGQLVRAVNLFREVSGLFAQLNHPGQRWGLAGIALAAGQMGDRATGDAAVAELVAMPLPSVRLMDVNVLRGQAWAHVATGDLAGAREALWEAKHLALKWGQLAGAADALFDLVRIGEKDALEELRGLAGQVDGDLMSARVSHAEAVAEQDPLLAGRAAEQFESIGALLLAAESAALDHRLSRGRGLHRRAAAALRRGRAVGGALRRREHPRSLVGPGRRTPLVARARGGATGGQRAHQPRHRRAALRVETHGGQPPATHLHQAWRHEPPSAGHTPARHRGDQRSRSRDLVALGRWQPRAHMFGIPRDPTQRHPTSAAGRPRLSGRPAAVPALRPAGTSR